MILTPGTVAVLLASATAAEPIPTSQAAAAFSEMRAACAADGGRLWKRDLCGPVVFVDPQTRMFVADREAPVDAKLKGGLFLGRLPSEMNAANTAVEWGGGRWTMVLWPLPSDKADRLGLLMHEAFHRVQPDLKIPMRSPVPAHLADANGRAGMRMEWRALAAALSAADDAARRTAIADALAFRAWRRSLAPDAGRLENDLELNEGLAEYTGQKLSGRPDAEKHAASALARAEGQESYARSFAYASGPAYGLLLDRYEPGWRGRISQASDLGQMLAAAVRPSVPDWKAAGARYGFDQVLAEEAAAAAERDRQAAQWRAKLVDGPVLRLPFGQMQIQFDPGKLFPLQEHGTVYPALRITDAWGVLEVKEGALVDGSWSGVRVVAPSGAAETGQLSGPGWTLKLAPGWRLRPGARAGDFTIAKAE
ncbi:MAG TPA: hypothetical protein VD929_11470 [Caulobacteraceae bacterium]|nr:hypothetical protein [Caulobacteraceae bacterium]